MSALDLRNLRKRHTDDKKLLAARVDQAIHSRVIALCEKANVTLQAYLEGLIVKDLVERDGRSK
jgi:hypothetical protein